VALYFLYLADFGLQTLGTRTIAQEKGNISRHVWDITFLRLILAILCFILLVVFSALIPKPADVQYLIILFGLALLPSALVLEWVFQGLEQMEYVGIGRILKGIVFAGLVFFLKSPDHLLYAPAAYVAGIVVAAAILLWIYVKKFEWKLYTINFFNLKKTLMIAVPLAAGSFITQINYNFGTFALGLFRSDETVGLFSAAYKIVLFMWAFAVVAASNAILPLLARSYKLSVGLFSNSLKKLLRIFVFIAIPVGIGGSVLASRIIRFLYPPEYQEAAIVLQLSIWVVVIVIYRVIFENALIVSKSQRFYFIGYITAGVLTILGNLLLVPVFGLIAPSIVGISAEFILLLYFITTSKFVRFSYIFKVTIKPLLAALLMGIVLMFLNIHLFLLMLIGIITYFIVLLLLRGITMKEILSAYR
jgi:O-antigen/teichoic acid export membrane protein